jgi:hypothetical protein
MEDCMPYHVVATIKSEANWKRAQKILPQYQNGGGFDLMCNEYDVSWDCPTTTIVRKVRESLASMGAKVTVTKAE